MRKLFTLLFLFSIFFSCYAKAAESVAEYPYTENFDDTEAGMMPEGWATAGSSTFSVSSAMDYAAQAQSGANVIVSGYPQTSNRTDVAFSPMLEMKGGVEYTMTVWVMAKNLAQNGRNPGYKITVGNAQTTEAQTVELAAEEGECDWKEITVTFTPEADGQYCFGLWCSSVLSSAGDVFFDTFSVTAAETVEEPAQTAALPYSENFDTTEEMQIPAGWATAGTSPFAAYPTSDWYGTQAQSGLNALVSGYPQTGNRADVAFSPMFEMKAGVKYTMTVWVMTTNTAQNGRNPGYKITAGNAQTAEAQTVELAAEEGLCDWKEVTVTFTPEADGQYCFGLWCNSVLTSAGDVYFDTFSVTEEETVEEPAQTAELPYSESFDTTEEMQIPAGWATAGTSPFAAYPTSDWYGVQAQSGLNALVSGYPQTGNRADVAFSPMFEMKAGVKYTMTVWVMTTNSAQNGRNPGYKITAGNAQTVEAQTVELAAEEGLCDWKKVTVTFTPEADGQYCFGLWCNSVLSSAGDVYFDTFSVTEEETVEEPVDPNKELPYSENFDTTAEEQLPAGWTSEGTAPFATYPTFEWYGVQAQSGSNALVSGYPQGSNRADVAFSPMFEMKGGVEYTMTVWVKMTTAGQVGRTPSMKITAGLAQVADAQIYELTTDEGECDWKEVSVKFTPETDGQYCFGLWCTSVLSSAGDVFFDTFSVAESGGGEEPTWKAEIPYLETYDDGSHYSGKDYLPIGWTVSGENPWVTANIPGKQAVSGEYYMVAESSILPNRQDIAYSPMLDMKGGQTYTVSMYLYMPGTGSVKPSFKLTAGNAQETTAQTTVLEEITETAVGDWTKIEKDFTPTEDGKYCFAIHACSASANDGRFAIDNFSVTEKDMVLPPTAVFHVGNTLNSIFSGSSVVFEGQKVKMVNMSSDADSYKWSVNNGATISDEEAAEPEITFPASGSYTITLQATNEGGTTEAEKTFYTEVLSLENDVDDALTTTSETTDKLYQQADTPAFDENGEVKEIDTYEIYYDYVVGVNPYYRSIAERFELPSDVTLDISSLSILTPMYQLFINDTGEGSVNDKDKTYTVVIYPEKDGKIDTEHPIASKTEKLAKTFGEEGYYQPVRQSIKFDESAKVTGTFYVAFECEELDLVDETAEGRGYRSWIGFETRKHANKQTTLYVKPEKALPGSDYTVDGAWCKADEFCPSLEGYSFCVMPWVKFNKMETNAIGSVTDNNVEIEISADGENYRVSGLADGESVRVYSVSGVQVFNGKARGGEVVIPASGWSNGIYVINAGNESVKILK